MKKKTNQSAGARAIQVFELTMDNPEDQDELNRRLRKPGQLVSSRPTKIGRTPNSEPTTQSNGKKKAKGKGTS
jgi:hypothetical protein